MSAQEEMLAPFHELPDGSYEIRLEGSKWWLQSKKEGQQWKSPIGRFRAHENDGVVAVRKQGA